MKNKQIISASILSANFVRLGEEVDKVLAAGADWIHIDVMDNHYVPNLTFGPLVCEALRRNGMTAPLDVHLMVKPVDDLIEAFAKAGANCITFHPEASEHVDRSLQLIRDLGCKAGLALNPATPLACLQYVLDKLDMVLLMSVNPGFAGQAFIPSTLEKIREAKQLVSHAKHPIMIAVDGGVKHANISAIAEAGAEIFVVGSAIFNSGSYQVSIEKLKAELKNIKH